MKKLYSLLIASTIILASYAQSPGICGKNNLPQINNGSGSLGQTYNYTDCGLNYVQASQLIQTRTATYNFNANGTGLPTVLSVTGIPATATIVKAYAWYIVSYIGATAQTSSVVITNPYSITSTIPSTNIGQDQSKCWGETGTVVYRADVTSAITGNGSYNLNINGITGTGGNFPNWYDQIDGITLFIIYKDLNVTYQGSFVIWDGDMTGVGNNYTQTMTGINACANSTYANAFIIVSDMQENVNGNAHPSTLNGVTANFSNDYWNFDDTTTIVTTGQATATFVTDGLGSDCFAWAMMGLYYQTANCMVCSACTTTFASVDSVDAASACLINDGAIYISDSTAAPPLTYSWSNGATTQDISGLSPGTYTLTITDSTNCSVILTVNVPSSSNLYVSVNSITTVSCSGGNNGSIDINVGGGTAPYIYNWSNGATTQDVSGLSYGTYSLTVTDSSGCSVSLSASVQAAPNLPVPMICMVTVDSLSQNNVIIWDKNSFPYDSVIIYREIATNNYQPIGAVSRDSLSLFVDTVRTKYFPNTGDPNAGTYRYKIQLKDSCGNLSAFSPYHNTIFITNNNGNFNWQFYTIENNLNPVNAYVLMRDDYSNGNWNAINSVSGTQQTVSDPAYSNWQSTASYRIQTLWNITCTPSRINPDILASFNSSKSNISSMVSAVGETSLNDFISIYPNPSLSEFTIYNTMTANNYEVKITNTLGEIVLEKTVNKKTETINLTTAKGIYFLHITTSNGTAVKKIVKE